jgi:AcrR family transcriptional regulator
MAASRPSPLRRSRARRGAGGQLRDEIVAATAKLLAETGDEESVSIRKIADAVGVTPPSVYLHFPDKAALIMAVCEDRLLGLDRALAEAAVEATDPLDDLLRRCRAYVEFGLANPEHYRIVFMSRPTPDDVPKHTSGTAVLEHMVEAVQRAVDEQAIPYRDARSAALQLWFAMHGLTALLLSRPQRDLPPAPEAIDATVAQLRVQLLAPDPTSSP